MGYNDIDGLEHDKQLAEALGNMVVAWARAETAIMNVFICILDIPFNAAQTAYYRIPTFEARCKLVRALLSEWKPKKHDAKKIDVAVNKIGKLGKTRNGWIHGVWCLNEEKPETVIFDFRAPEKSVNRRRRTVKTNDVLHHVETVRKRTKELNFLVPHPQNTNKTWP